MWLCPDTTTTGCAVAAGAIRPGSDVPHHDAHASQFDLGPGGQGVGPAPDVDVTAHGDHRGDQAQCPEHFGRSDVPGVDDVVDALKELRHLRVEMAVGVGDDADDQRGGAGGA